MGASRRRTAASLLAGAALLVSGAGGGTAQTTGSDTVPRYDLDSLVVSVLRSPVRLGTAPYSISVLGRSGLRRGKDGMFLAEALQGLPGVQVQNRYNYAVGERISIRGFGSRSQFGVRGIRVLVDGVPATLADGQSTLDHVDIGSLGRVEALRGPAAALYGNAAGGVLRFQSEIPSASSVRNEVTAVGGSDGLLRLQNTTSGTVDGTGYLVSLDRLAYDGYRSTPDGDPWGGAKRVHVNGRVTHGLAGGEVGVTFNRLDLKAQNPGSLPLAAFEEDPHQVWPTYIAFRTRKEVRQSQLGVTWSGPVGEMEAEGMAYGITRGFLNPLPADVVDVDRRAGGARVSLSDGLRVGGARLRILGGLEADVQHDARREFASAGGEEGDLQLDQAEEVRSVGLFLQTAVSLRDRVDVVAGLRWDRFRFAVDDHFPVSSSNPDDSGGRTMHALSPTVGIHLAATAGVDVFANYASFFETPTTVELGNREGSAGGFNPDLDPETGRTFELGARGATRDLLSWEITLFATRLAGELIPYELSSAPGLTYYRNAGSSTRRGVEGVVRGRVGALLTGQLSCTWTDALFRRYVVDGESYRGRKVPGLAPWDAQGSLRFGPPEWYLEVAAVHRGAVPVDDANDAPFVDAYTLVDVRLGGTGLRIGALELSPFAGVRNLGDATYVSSVAVNAFGGRYYEPGPYRTFYAGGTLAVSR